MDSRQIGEKLVELCRQGKNLDAVNTLYSPDIVSVEAQGDEQMPAEMRGLDAIRGKNEWWISSHEVHSANAEGPFVNQDRFSVLFDFDVTAKSGPMSGQRMQMKEVAVYTVGDGKIVREDFFY
jgi:ketosteroid isomerase-like protein